MPPQLALPVLLCMPPQLALPTWSEQTTSLHLGKDDVEHQRGVLRGGQAIRAKRQTRGLPRGLNHRGLRRRLVADEAKAVKSAPTRPGGAKSGSLAAALAREGLEGERAARTSRLRQVIPSHCVVRILAHATLQAASGHNHTPGANANEAAEASLRLRQVVDAAVVRASRLRRVLDRYQGRRVREGLEGERAARTSRVRQVIPSHCVVRILAHASHQAASGHNQPPGTNANEAAEASLRASAVLDAAVVCAPALDIDCL